MVVAKARPRKGKVESINQFLMLMVAASCMSVILIVGFVIQRDRD